MRPILILALVGFACADVAHLPHQIYGQAPTTPTSAYQYFPGNHQSINDLTNNVDQYSPPAYSNFPTSPLTNFETQRSFEPTMLYESPVNYNNEAMVGYKNERPIVTKRFFIHSAPEEEEESLMHKTIHIGKSRKNFNVVFIRAPTKAQQRHLVKIVPATHEEKTVVYVLAKKQDALDIDAHVQEPPTTTTKPEVFFIKYKTQEEAEHAQHSIQAKYDALGGSTQITNEGVAQVSSVIGSLENSSAKGYSNAYSEAHTQTNQGQGYTTPEISPYQQFDDGVGTTQNLNSNDYLPPTRFRQKRNFANYDEKAEN